jgi:glycogen synthase
MIVSSPFPKRILMTADTVGGVWTYAMELCRALGVYGIEIALATMGAPLSPSQRTEAASLQNIRIFESDYKLEWMADPWDEVDSAGEWIMKLEDEFQPDLVHLNNFSHGALPWRAPKIVVGHSCVLSWWQATKRCEAPREWDMYRTRVMEGLALADFVIAPSRAMLTSLEQHYGPFAGCGVIPNGRGLSRNRSRAKHNFILGAGRLWDEAKNVAALASCAPNLSWPVFVAGEKREPNGKETQHSQIRHLGHLPQSKLQAWFERAAIFAAPARYEPFGLSILEAALAGCALVLGDIPSLRENWNDAALFVAPEDPRALEVALERLINTPELRHELSLKARETASRFTPERMAENYVITYSSVLTRSLGSIVNTAILAAAQGQPGLGSGKGISCAS